jgi:iron(III) transport system permease protein
MALLGRGGFLPQTAHQWFGIDKTVNWLSGGWGAGMILGFCYFPILAYLVVSGLRASDPHHEEAGMFALSEWGILKKITLPLLLPHIGSGFLLVFLLSITNYAVPALLGVRTFAVKIYTHFSVFQDSGGAVLLSLPLLVISAAAVLILGILMKDRAFFSMNPRREQGSSLRLFQTRIFKALSHGPALLVTAVPVIYLVVGTGSISNLTMAWQQSWGSIFTSFWLALLSSLFITLLGFFSGYPLARVPLLSSWASRVLFLFPFALPSVLMAIGIIHLWNRPALHWAYQSVLVLTLLWAVKYLPLAQRTIADHIHQLPVEMEEAAFLCRLSWFGSFFRIVWPLTRPGFLVTWAITYIFCLAELGGTLLVIPPGVDTMPVRLYNVMHYGSSGVTAALGLFLLMMTVIPITLLLVCRRWLVGVKGTEATPSPLSPPIEGGE